MESASEVGGTQERMGTGTGTTGVVGTEGVAKEKGRKIDWEKTTQ
jgi:hypothetical protein